MNLATFLTQLAQSPEQVEFNDTMAVIDANYNFTPSKFTNGNIENEADTNNGSCKIFAFGKLNGLSEQQVLACFGNYYRNDVLKNLAGDNHQNIRNFIISGWSGIQFNDDALVAK